MSARIPVDRSAHWTPASSPSKYGHMADTRSNQESSRVCSVAKRNGIQKTRETEAPLSRLRIHRWYRGYRAPKDWLITSGVSRWRVQNNLRRTSKYGRRGIGNLATTRSCNTDWGDCCWSVCKRIRRSRICQSGCSNNSADYRIIRIAILHLDGLVFHQDRRCCRRSRHQPLSVRQAGSGVDRTQCALRRSKTRICGQVRKFRQCRRCQNTQNHDHHDQFDQRKTLLLSHNISLLEVEGRSLVFASPDRLARCLSIPFEQALYKFRGK